MQFKQDKTELKVYVQNQLKDVDKHSQRILILLDGYDEYNNKENKIFDDVISLAEYRNVKVIMTSREKYADNTDYRHCFGEQTHKMQQQYQQHQLNSSQ